MTIYLIGWMEKAVQGPDLGDYAEAVGLIVGVIIATPLVIIHMLIRLLFRFLSGVIKPVKMVLQYPL